MMLDTTRGVPVTGQMLRKYLRFLIGRLFKILPLRENEEPTLSVYIEDLQAELLGCRSLIAALHEDARLLSIINELQYLSDHPNDPVYVYKRIVFGSINTCEALTQKYSSASLNEEVTK